MSEWLIKLICAALILFYAGLVVQSLRTRGKGRFRLHLDPFIVILQLRPVLYRALPMLERPKISLTLLNGGVCTLHMLIGWAAETLGIAYIALLVTALLAMQSGNAALLCIGAIVACCLPILRARELSGQVDKRRQAIVMELPELLSKLLLMVNAGDPVMRALARTVEQKRDSNHPLYTELKAAIEGLKRGESLADALEGMGRRCAVPEVKLFATTVLINARRGGEDFVPALRELTRQMWERRKALARTLGEQASSRLAFPLAIVFMLIMVLVGAPTLLMM